MEVVLFIVVLIIVMIILSSLLRVLGLGEACVPGLTKKVGSRGDLYHRTLVRLESQRCLLTRSSKAIQRRDDQPNLQHSVCLHVVEYEK